MNKQWIKDNWPMCLAIFMLLLYSTIVSVNLFKDKKTNNYSPSVDRLTEQIDSLDKRIKLNENIVIQKLEFITGKQEEVQIIKEKTQTIIKTHNDKIIYINTLSNDSLSSKLSRSIKTLDSLNTHTGFLLFDPRGSQVSDISN